MLRRGSSACLCTNCSRRFKHIRLHDRWFLDGIFGNNTYNAVRRYQEREVGGLAVDGIIGCNTWRSLQENV